MTSERTDPTSTRRARRAQRLVAAGFLGAFGLTMVTVLLTGLAVKAHRSRDVADAPAERPANEAPASREQSEPALEPRPQETGERGPDDEAVGERDADEAPARDAEPASR